VPTTKGSMHGGKGGGFGVPPGRLRGHQGGGEETPSKPESSRDDDEEEDEDEEEGEITPMTPSFHSPPHEDLTSLTW
jgi:hypothetical protein